MMKQGSITKLAASLLMLGMSCAAQVLEPGQNPAGPPAQPGQLGPAPKKLPPDGQLDANKNQQPTTIGDVIGSARQFAVSLFRPLFSIPTATDM